MSLTLSRAGSIGTSYVRPVRGRALKLSSGSLGYQPALDGIRAVAVLAVFFYHFDRSLLPGGYLGVDVFFVLSGFLITSVLVDSRLRQGHAVTLSFWKGRIRRLPPALTLLLLFLLVFSHFYPTYFSPSLVARQAFFTAVYSQNWYLIATDPQSYFLQLNPSPLLHTWSLSIEEQFYLIWPFLIGLSTVRLRAQRDWRARVFGVSLATGLASYAGLVVLTLLHASQNLIYYSSGTRAFELAAGGALCAWCLRRSPQELAWSDASLAGVTGFLLFFAVLVSAPDSAYGMALWGALCSLGTVLVIACCVREPLNPVARLLSLGPLAYVGRISYGIYLWHWPLILLFERVIPSNTALRAAVTLAATFAAAALSYHLVEVRIRRGRDSLSIKTLFAVALAFLSAGASVLYMKTPAEAAVRPTVFPAELSPIEAQSVAQINTYLRSALGAVDELGPPQGSLVPLKPPFSITYAGDSLMYQLEVALSSALSPLSSAQYLDGRPGWDITVPPAPYVALSQTRADSQMVVMMFSLGAAEFASMGQDRTEAFLNQVVSYYFEHGAREVVFLEPPPLGPEGTGLNVQSFSGYSPTGRRYLEQAERALAEKYPGKVAYLPLAPVLQSHGSYATWLSAPLGYPVRVRQLDNFHFCPYGAARYALATELYLSYLMHLTVSPASWWQGRWTQASRFSHIENYQSPGQCPNDAPK